ncbi:MAG: flagellar hook-basal body complex protein FliE [Pirellulaceae bacterium]
MNSIAGSPTFHLQLPHSARLQQPTDMADRSPQTFGELMAAGVMGVNDSQQNATAQVHELLSGGDVSQVEVLTAVQKADMSFRLLVQVRNKLMSAYEEINAIRI